MIYFNKKDSVADSIKDIMEKKELSPKQKEIAKMSPPADKIDSGDLAKLRAGHKTVKEEEVQEEIDPKVRTKDTAAGSKKTNQTDDVGPGSDGKSTKVKYRGGPMTTSESFTLRTFKEKYEDNSIYDQMINEVLSKDASAGQWIHDFVHSDNPKFAGKSKAQRKKQALAAYYAKQRNEEVEQIDEELKTKTAYVPYVYTDKHGSGFGGYDVHYSKEADAHAHVAKHGHIDNNGKKGWVEKHEIAKHPSGRWVDANHMRRHGVSEEVEQVEENSPFDWKKPREPEVKGGSGVKKGTRYGGSAQKSKPEQDDEEPKKKVTESKRTDTDNVPFDPPFNTTSDPVVTDKSGAKHTPMSRVKHLARLAMKRVKKDVQGK
jgi:hypothetical protein